jgi:chromosomal replication initiator protein
MDTRVPVATLVPSPDRTAAFVTSLDAPLPSFEFTVVGLCNQLAYRAVRRFADDPGTEFEALLLTGPAGCGKTHFLQALYVHLLAARRCPAVLFVPADRFHRHFVHAIRRRLLEPFRRKYRTADVLLLDDIQCLATKPRTQGEFLHTLDTLLQDHRRVIVTSDRPLPAIEGLSPPLRDRLLAAVAIRMDRPDPAIRRAFLEDRVRAWGLSWPESALDEIASRSGAGFHDLTRCLAAFRDGAGDGRERARRALDALRRTAGEAASADEIARLVASAVGVRPEDLRERRRTRALVRARRLCFYLGRRHTPLTLEALGRAFGGHDHATVHLAVRRLEADMKGDPLLAGLVQRLDGALANRTELAATDPLPRKTAVVGMERSLELRTKPFV